MSKFKKTNESLPTPVNGADAFAAAGSELGGSTLPILKMSKAGEWVSGTENMPVTEKLFAADVQGAQRGFICFVDGELVDEVMVPVARGVAISLEELADHGPYQDGDGWTASASIQLRSIETGDEFVYKPSSQGGRSAIGGLLTKYSFRLGAGKGGIPIVELENSSYEHRRFGIVNKPVLKLVSWKDEADLVNGIDAKPGEGLRDDDIPF